MKICLFTWSGHSENVLRVFCEWLRWYFQCTAVEHGVKLHPIHGSQVNEIRQIQMKSDWEKDNLKLEKLKKRQFQIKNKTTSNEKSLKKLNKF